MKDIKLLERCPDCHVHITLMTSINVETGKNMLVKRCLNCGNYQVAEIAEIVDSVKAYCEYCDEDIQPIRVIENTEMNIKGTQFNFDKIMNRCPSCNNEVYIEKDNQENVKVAHELYLEAKKDK